VVLTAVLSATDYYRNSGQTPDLSGGFNGSMQHQAEIRVRALAAKDRRLRLNHAKNPSG
jgi:hypothetical protein